MVRYCGRKKFYQSWDKESIKYAVSHFTPVSPIYIDIFFENKYMSPRCCCVQRSELSDKLIGKNKNGRNKNKSFCNQNVRSDTISFKDYTESFEHIEKKYLSRIAND